MESIDRRNILRAALGLAAAAACGMTLSDTAEAAPLPTLHQPVEPAGEDLLQTIARRSRRRRRRGRIIIRRPRRRIIIRPRRRRRVCWRNRRGRLVCAWRW